ncbi:MAG TPA: hypothetical protein VF331_04645 [Polyangiales bacterium]
MNTLIRSRFWLLATLCAALPLSLFAQDSGLPTFSGKGSVTQAIDTVTGAVFDLGAGITMTFPKGLPVGHSRLITLKKAGKKPSGAQIQKGFSAVGTALEISVPLNAPDAPIVLAQSWKSDPRKLHQRLVLAMEVGTLCTQENKAFKLNGGLCSGWELIDARYDDSDKRLIAELHSTGGLRMVFGTVSDE